jgi:hypothetical protein
VLRSTIVSAIFCFSTGAPSGQVKLPALTGTVVDSAGHPIAFAVVSALGTGYAVQTDPRGRFAFDSLPQSWLTLRADFIGYLPALETLVVQRTRTTSVHFRLVPRAFVDSGNIIRGRTAAVSDSNALAVPPETRTCAPTSAKLPTNATAAGLAGDYYLTIIGTDGEAMGKMVRGDLRLWAPPDSFRYIRQFDGKRNPHVTTPLIGRTGIRLQDVGAVEDGGWGATEPEAPGIAVQEHHASYQGQPFAEITLRLGADGNTRGVLRFDGPYNALYVDRIDPLGFYGRWHASLGYTTYKAEGFFCALRRH